MEIRENGAEPAEKGNRLVKLVNVPDGLDYGSRSQILRRSRLRHSPDNRSLRDSR